MVNYKEPLVRISGGNRLITTSLAISQHFGKKHQHVLEAIKNLDCSREFNESNFRPISYTDGRGRQKPAYEITRDGFMFLCMGFTGRAAARWKEKYIVAFNTLEQTLHHNSVNLEQMQAQLLAAKPLWKAIKRYKQLGLNHVEIGKLVDRDKSTIRDHVRKMERYGILPPPKNLAKLQRMALILQSPKTQPAHTETTGSPCTVTDWERNNLPPILWGQGYHAGNLPKGMGGGAK